MLLPSFNLSPAAPVLVALSLPARSTRLNLPTFSPEVCGMKIAFRPMTYHFFGTSKYPTYFFSVWRGKRKEKGKMTTGRKDLAAKEVVKYRLCHAIINDLLYNKCAYSKVFAEKSPMPSTISCSFPNHQATI